MVDLSECMNDSDDDEEEDARRLLLSSVCWLSNGTVVVGTSLGHILLIDFM
jgi:hypothetical protein